MAIRKGANNHVFGVQRPSHNGDLKVHTTPKRDTHFRPLPQPTGDEPFHLDLKSIISDSDYKDIVRKKKLVFHLNGDMGGINYDVPQRLVAKGMESDIDQKLPASERPSFLYICGDCVYFNGEVKEYYKQFYQPYEYYPGPIFAVPGNHDGENLEDEDSLKGFVRNFCAKEPVKMPESGDSHRTAMIQPNVYWVLRTPLANFIGLYSNVPAGGEIKSPQTEWLVDQLKKLPKSQPVFVALHHPIYSADDHHSGSTHMKNVLEEAAKKAKRSPDMVFAGHVHNYQRITEPLAGGKSLPHLVTGAGGYHHLHNMVKVEGERLVPPVSFKDKAGDSVTVERFSADHHGFMRIEITEDTIVGKYYIVPRPQDSFSKPNHLLDYFEFDWKKKKYKPNQLP